MLRATSRQRRLPPVPNLTEGAGAEACVSILHLAKADGWEHSIGHGERIKWFEAKHEMFFADGGALSMYKHCGTLSVRRKFIAAENNAKSLYERRGHQPSHDEYLDESTLPLYCRLFFEYFTYAEERSNHSSAARAQRWRNVRVNRSVIGQQPALSSTNEVGLNGTQAPTDRTRGTGEVAGDIVINEISQGASSESNNEFSEGSSENNRRQTFSAPNTPRRRHAPNDGRASRATRSRTYNVANYPSLPPSTGGHRSVNFDRLSMGYNSIADSINNLAYQQRIRNRIDINRDLTLHVEKKIALVSAGAEQSVIDIYARTIADLEEERNMAMEYERYMAGRIRVMAERESITEELFPVPNESTDSIGQNNNNV